jgi:hypothetical protein
LPEGNGRAHADGADRPASLPRARNLSLAIAFQLLDPPLQQEDHEEHAQYQ